MSEPTDFEKGATAMFDYFMYWAANHYHGNPEIDKLCQKESDLVTELAEDALESVSLETLMKWKSITELQQEINRLRGMVNA